MAPITDDIVDALRDTIHKLESRVQQLEAKLGHADGSTPAGSSNTSLQSVRMILMGPPGAGTHTISWKVVLHLELTLPLGKGTQAPKIKDKYCACHLVSCPNDPMCATPPRMLISLLGNRGHAAISGSEEDLAREGSQEDNGSRRAGQR